jgi:hypothetical protein
VSELTRREILEAATTLAALGALASGAATLVRVWTSLRHRRMAALLVVLAGAGGIACSLATRPGRVLIVGIDGASMRVIEPMLAAGRLPNLAAIARTGASGKLHSLQPLLSPRIWTSVATGKPPAEHGILGWVLPPKAGEATRLYDSHDRRVHALWNIFSRHGRSIATVNWLMTYPPEPVNGVMISDYAYPEEVGAKIALGRTFASAGGGSLREPGALREPTAWPAEWVQRALAERHREPLISLADPFASIAGTKLWAGLASASVLVSRDQGLVSAALEVEAELHPDLLMILLQGIDRISHSAFGTLEDESTWDPAYREPAEERPLAREALLGFYAYTDALIGRLVERYEAGDLVIVLSDHGFAAAEEFPLGEHTEGDALDGVIFARGRGIAPGSSAAGEGVLDVAPTVLAWAGLPAGRDMPGHVAAFLETEPPAPIASYETVPVRRLSRSASGSEAERIEQLRALGYVE